MESKTQRTANPLHTCGPPYHLEHRARTGLTREEAKQTLQAPDIGGLFGKFYQTNSNHG